eukprot:scaffold19621_cov129-Isochrysis_galbana.AAC.2
MSSRPSARRCAGCRGCSSRVPRFIWRHRLLYAFTAPAFTATAGKGLRCPCHAGANTGDPPFGAVRGATRRPRFAAAPGMLTYPRPDVSPAPPGRLPASRLPPLPIRSYPFPHPSH